jgi:hypothetical protein
VRSLEIEYLQLLRQKLSLHLLNPILLEIKFIKWYLKPTKIIHLSSTSQATVPMNHCLIQEGPTVSIFLSHRLIPLLIIRWVAFPHKIIAVTVTTARKVVGQ